MSYEHCWSADEFIDEFDRRCRRRLARATRRRRRVPRWDAPSTWHPPHANPHTRADLHHDALAAGRAAWRAEVDALASLARPVPSAALRHIWSMHEQRLSHASLPPDPLRHEHLTALRHLFDFSTTPITSPTTPLDQHVFLPADSNTTAPTLDEVASEISSPSAPLGLYCLAGLPGSGKTTTLHRIEHLARQQPRPPVTLRLDLPPTLDPQTFLPRLTSNLCRAIQHHCHLPPHIKPLQPNFTHFALARLAQACRTYRAHAAAILIPLAAFALYHALTTPSPLPAWTYATAAVLLSVLFLGTCATLSRFLRLTLPPWPTLLLLTLSPAAAILCQSAGYPPAQILHLPTLSTQHSALITPTLNPPTLAAFLLATLAATGLAIILLPPWWPTYTRATSLLLRRKPLPEPALHDLLADCRRTFGGVLLLIDGADHLPLDDLRQLLRLLRPLARSDSARTLLAVPRFLPAALPTFADPHTPIHRWLLLADPLTRPTDDAPLTPHELESLIHPLLLSRLRIPLSDPLPPCDAPLSHALAPWLDLPDETLRHIHLIGPTRRDLIRECEALLLDPARRPFPPAPPRDLPAERDLLHRLRAEHPALLADLLYPAPPPRLTPPPDLPAYYVATPAHSSTPEPA